MNVFKRSVNAFYSKSAKQIINHFSNKKVLRHKLNDSQKIFNEYLEKNKPAKLQIGCGFNVIPGWLNTDLNSGNGVAYLDAAQKYSLPDSSFDFVFSEHLFEHLTLSQELQMLAECFRIMKKNGVIRIAVPCMDFLFAIYSDPKKEIHRKYIEWAMEKVPALRESNKLVKEKDFREIYVINNFFRDWGHQTIHTFDSIKNVLEKAGFSQVSRKEVGKSTYPEFCDMERHGKIIPEEFNLLETMVVEAVKA
jgi:hypothetical protein